MTPSEIIQAIKTSPIKERQAERNICDFSLDTLYSIHQSILNEMNDLRDEIDKKRAEVMAIMYLEGRVKLTEEAIPYLDKNYCKPIKYKPINQFSYENFKSNTDALRNYGWSDLLLSGVTPTRSKSQKHAKHH